MKKKFVAKISLDDNIPFNHEVDGEILIVGSKTSGLPYIWVGSKGRIPGVARATVEPKSMDALCKAWIALRKSRKEWKP